MAGPRKFRVLRWFGPDSMAGRAKSPVLFTPLPPWSGSVRHTDPIGPELKESPSKHGGPLGNTGAKGSKHQGERTKPLSIAHASKEN